MSQREKDIRKAVVKDVFKAWLDICNTYPLLSGDSAVQITETWNARVRMLVYALSVISEMPNSTLTARGETVLSLNLILDLGNFCLLLS